MTAVFPCYNDEPRSAGSSTRCYAALDAARADGRGDRRQRRLRPTVRRPCSTPWRAERPWLRVVHHDAQPRVRPGADQWLLGGRATTGSSTPTATPSTTPARRPTSCRSPPSDVDIVQGYKIGRGDSWYRKVIGRTYHHGVKLMFGLKVRDTDCDFRLFRRRLFTERPLSSSSGVICVEMMYPLPARRCALRRGARAPLLPPARSLAVLPVAGDPPQRPATAGAVVAVGDPWTLKPGLRRLDRPANRRRRLGAIGWRGPRPTDGALGDVGGMADRRPDRSSSSGAISGSPATTGRSSSRANGCTRWAGSTRCCSHPRTGTG